MILMLKMTSLLSPEFANVQVKPKITNPKGNILLLHKVGFLSVMKAGKMLYLCLLDTIEAMIIFVGMTSVKFLARSCLYITDCSVILGGVLIL